MADFLQLLVAGLATGGIYALVAIGFTLLWQTSQTINFAQGEFVMVPAFLALIAMRWLGVPVERMILYTFLINAALVTLASILITPIYLAKFTNGEWLGLYAFIAAIIGGFNQVRGAIVGGVLLGVIGRASCRERV